MIPILRMLERVDRARDDSDTALFYDLLSLGELVIKLTTAGMVAAIQEERERHRYRIEYDLIRADGLGDWIKALDDVVTGPAGQHLADLARVHQVELTKHWSAADDSWQWRAVNLLEEVAALLDPSIRLGGGRPQLRKWFERFVWLRNRTRGHGAVTSNCCSSAVRPLEASIREIVDNSVLFSRSWVFLRRNLSGKYRVVPFACGSEPFDHLKSTTDATLQDGVYLDFGRPCRSALIETDVDLSDFFLANGGYRSDSFELISYVTDEHRYVPSAPFQTPPTALLPSATEGKPALDVLGKCFTNLPTGAPGYVRRPGLESSLQERLLDERHPIVTLVGLGGIGKTSLALEVLHALANEGAFYAIFWFSARDIDLMPEGPKSVMPHVLAPEEIAREYARLMQPAGASAKGFDPLKYLAESLAGTLGSPEARQLFVFDNFETVRSPVDLYRWIDDCIRLPNKVLITTRMRQFKADYPVEVKGMTEAEFAELVASVASKLGITPLITPGYGSELYHETDGHPYVAKVLLGEAARNGVFGAVERIMATKENILEALFERTYSELNPTAQRVFLTLCNWRSVVPAIALEAVLMRPGNERMDVEGAVETLVQSSMVDVVTSGNEGDEFLSVPLAANLFGRGKLKVSPARSAVEADTELIRYFGAAQSTDLRRGMAPRVERLFAAIAGRVQADGRALDELLPIVEFVASRYPAAWVHLANLYLEYDQLERALEVMRRYLQKRPDDIEGWRMLAVLSRRSGDFAGEINALCSLAELPETPFGEVSDAANRFNGLLRDKLLDVDTDERRVMAQSLRKLMESRLNEADATDLSRLAWLCHNLQDHVAARSFAEKGLALDPGNFYCQRLIGPQT